MHYPLHSLRARLYLVALALATVACGNAASVPQDNGAAAFVSMAPAAAPRAERALSDASVGAGAEAQVSPATDPPATTNVVLAPSMIIRNGTATVEVDSLELAIAAVQNVALRMGGYVGNTSLSAGSYAVRSATLELKIPAARYDSTVRGLAPVGRVLSLTSTAQDVGEEFVDVTARQANARRLEERLVLLLTTRTGKLEDVLAVERELARIREEIERYEGRLRYLRAHIATSTLVVTVQERAPIVSQYAGRNVITESIKDAWRNFVAFIALFIASLGWLIPVVGVLSVAVVAVKRARRKP